MLISPNYSEDDEDDNIEFDREVLEACNNNSSHIVNTIEYLLTYGHN